MSKSLYLECGSGISGDMTVAALLDLGADREVLEKSLESLKLPGYEIAITRVKKSGLDACDFNVILDAEHENHDHDMAYLHGDGAEVHDHPHDHEHHHDHDHTGEHITIMSTAGCGDSCDYPPRRSDTGSKSAGGADFPDSCRSGSKSPWRSA